MQTIRYSLSSLMQELDEQYIEEQYFSDVLSHDISERRVKKKIKNEILGRNVRFCLRYKYIFIVFFVMLCSVITVRGTAKIIHSLSQNLSQSEIVDDNNRDLIGTEIADSGYVIYSNGVYQNEKGEIIDFETLQEISNSVPASRIISYIEIPDFIPSSIVEIPTKEAEVGYLSPEVILTNASVCILTMEDGAGWTLKKDDMVTFDFAKYESKVVQDQALLIGYIKDGVMYEWDVFDEMEGQYSVRIEEEGEYYFYICSASSDYLTLKEGTLRFISK